MNRMQETHILEVDDQDSGAIVMKFDQFLGIFHFFILFYDLCTGYLSPCLNFCIYSVDRCIKNRQFFSNKCRRIAKGSLGFCFGQC